MSENEEKDRHKVATEATVIVVNQQSSADTRMPAYTSDLQDDSNEAGHKRAKIPAIPSVAADLKEAGTAQHIEVNKQENSEINTQTPAPTGLSKHSFDMLSSNSHMPELLKPCETIVLGTIVGTMETEPALKVIPPEPIPLDIKPGSRGSVHSRKTLGEDVSEEEALSDEIAVLPTREGTRLSDWSDEQEAGGLPRTESRASRVSRAVRQLFCCGVAFAPASEDDISTSRAFSAI